MITELRFFHAGMGNYVCANRVIAMIRPGTACGKRILKEAKRTGSFLDCCRDRPLRTILVLDDGGILGSAITAKTLASRANKEEADNPFEDDEEEKEVTAFEGNRSVGQDSETDDA